jgi:hypothetical protein
MWDPNPPAQLVTTYKVCVGTTSLSCNFKNVQVPATDTSYPFIPNAGVLYRVAIRAINAAGAGAYSPEVLVSVPSLGTLANRTSTVNAAISPVTITATDPDGSPVTFTHTGLPFGLTLNQSTGVISGTPTAIGTYNVTIFATDGLATAAAAFVWTVQTQSTDTTPPTLSITSHTNGQTVTTSSITLSGTATDSGTGNHGVQSVTVNGGAATGGTASGSNTASWSRSVTLASGANTITVVATDGVGNARTASITINRAASADTAAPTVSITSHANGAAVEGTSINLSGTATDNGTGGSGITSVTVNGLAATGGTATGNNTANWTRSVPIVNGTNTMTVVARDGAGNTRTVSIVVTKGTVTAVLTAVSVTPASGSGASQTFSAVFSDSVGATNLALTMIKFDTASAGAANSCMVRYDRAANRLSLRDNAGNWLTGAAPGSTATQSNSQCSLSLAGSSVAISGTNLTMNVAMTFAAPYAGSKNTYLYASSVSGISLNWQQRGTWTIATGGGGTLTAGPVTPNAGSGAAQLFSAQYSDSAGATDLAYVYLKFDTAAPGGTNTCMVRYDRAAATLSLRDDAGVWQTPQPFALGGTQQNAQCAVNFSASSASLSGQTLTLNVAMSFKVAYAGAKNIYAYASTIAGAITNWQQSGTWTVPSTMLSAGAVTPNAGSGSSGTFVAQFTDQKGVSDLSFVYLRFAASAIGATDVCMVRYEPTTGRMSIRDDSGNWLAAQTFAQGGTQQNSQCSIAFSSSTASASGSTLALTVNTAFKPAYAGVKNIYSYATSFDGSFTDWQLRGTWTVPGSLASSGD